MSDAAVDPAMATLLVARSPNGILATGPDGRVRLVNDALSTMVPIVPQPLGRTPIEAVPLPPLAEALGGTGEQELELRSGNKDLLVRVYPLDDRGGRVALVQDITRLREAQRARTDLVANISHELRTPATAIVGYAETLLEDGALFGADHLQALDAIHRNGRRLTEMFEDLLTLARLDALEESLPVEDVELAPIIAECIDRVRSAARARRIYFEVFVPVGQRAIANRDALAHVVGNLINNAVKYSHEEGLVTVRAQRRDPFVLVEVIDVGLGIDPIHHERIFQRFYRVDRGRSRAAGGTGLGLAIVKKLVDKMGCAIEVRSRPGHGSVFRLLLPRARAEVEPVPPPSAG